MGLVLGCHAQAPADGTSPQSAEGRGPGTAGGASAAEGAASAAEGAARAAEELGGAGPSPAEVGEVLGQLEGTWKIQSTSTDDGAGHVFQHWAGDQVEFRGDTLVFSTYGDSGHSELRKTVRVLRAEDAVLELVHRGDFEIPEPAGADAAARVSANSKGWSRYALVRVEGETMTLAVNFRTKPIPKSFDPDAESVEIVVLTRASS